MIAIIIIGFVATEIRSFTCLCFKVLMIWSPLVFLLGTAILNQLVVLS